MTVEIFSDDTERPSRPDPVVPDAISSISFATMELLQNPLAKRNKQIDADVRDAITLRKRQTAERRLPDMTAYPVQRVEFDLTDIVRANGFQCERLHLAPLPPSVTTAIPADLACNVATMARQNGQRPDEFARFLAEKFAEHELVKKAETSGTFINITLETDKVIPLVLNQIGSFGRTYGSFNEGKSDLVMLDYSHPNIAKNMTVAHLRSTIIGHALSKIYEAAGYTSFRVNHLGDWGTQFGKIIWQYNKEMRENPEEFQRRLESNPMAVLMEIYRKFTDAEKRMKNASGENEVESSEPMEEAASIFLRLEKGDPQLMALWDRFREWSMQEFYKVYDRLAISFDAFQGESFYEDRMLPAVEEALEKGVLKYDEQRAVIFPQQVIDDINGKSSTMTKDEIILKPSGGSVYLTRDLAAIKYRATELGAAKIVYIIGKEQQSHCSMFFAMSRQMGYTQDNQAKHVSFGHLNINGKKMKSRGGQMVLLNEVLDGAVQAAEHLLKVKKGTTDLTSEDMETAHKIGIGSVIFNDLRQGREKDIEFNPDAAVTLESGNCPYIQYTYCRLNSIREKIGLHGDASMMPERLSPEERALSLKLGMFPAAVKQALDGNAPHKIAIYLDELCGCINRFYQACDIKDAAETEKKFRLALIESCQQVLHNATDLLHIPLPERM